MWRGPSARRAFRGVRGADADPPPEVRSSHREDPLPDRGRGAPEAAAGGRRASLRARASRADRQHLDRRAHAGLGLLLLRRDARPLLPGRAARRAHRARRHQERRLRRHRQRALEGCGSSRETAPYSEREAGSRSSSRAASRRSTARTARTSGCSRRPISLLDRIARGDEIPIEEFTRGLDPISADVVEYGGLFAYNKARLAGEVSPPTLATPPRPMTLCEKIIAAHAIVDARSEEDRRPGGEAWRRALRPHRRALLARVRDADGRVAVPGWRRAGRDGDRARERLRLPGSPYVPRTRDAGGAPRGSVCEEQAASLATVQQAFTEAARASSSTARSSATAGPWGRRPSATTR